MRGGSEACARSCCAFRLTRSRRAASSACIRSYRGAPDEAGASLALNPVGADRLAVVSSEWRRLFAIGGRLSKAKGLSSRCRASRRVATTCSRRAAASWRICSKRGSVVDGGTGCARKGFVCRSASSRRRRSSATFSARALRRSASRDSKLKGFGAVIRGRLLGAERGRRVSGIALAEARIASISRRERSCLADGRRGPAAPGRDGPPRAAAAGRESGGRPLEPADPVLLRWPSGE